MAVRLSMQTRRELIQQMAPGYREASLSQKGVLLDEIAATTGCARRYAMWLLNHPQEVQQPPRPRRRQRTFGPEVRHALFLAWQAANCICSKRLMPFLPTLIESLERHGRLCLTDACRAQLLSMSATTQAGTLLKQQIPIRTFQQWNEKEPGFLEADLVAHCGSQAQGSFLYTLTLADAATGWTECLPLLNRGKEAVLAAFQRARALFPFPLLGLDTDNGGEFLNEDVAASCVREQMTFTLGRPMRNGISKSNAYTPFVLIVAQQPFLKPCSPLARDGKTDRQGKPSMLQFTSGASVYGMYVGPESTSGDRQKGPLFRLTSVCAASPAESASPRQSEFAVPHP